MKHVTAKDLSEMEKIYRRNLVNSCTGYKTANFIATKSEKGMSNVAVFNSVFHLGSNPAMLGFVLRPQTVPRNTYNNILETKFFTVNHIQENMIEQAHETAAQQSKISNEFENSGLDEEYLNDFHAPFVKQSSIKMGCEYVNNYSIEENESLIMVAKIEHLYFDPGIQMPDGWLRLDDAESVTINGLDGYALPQLLDRFHYAQPGQEIKSFFSNVKS